MDRLASCTQCSGFVLETAGQCPHCGAALRPERPSWRQRWSRRLFAIATSGTLAITLMACYGSGAYYDPCWDNDGDEFFPACYTEICDPQDAYCDCDDADSSVYPGAVDIPGDGIDHDCDGVDGDAAVTPAS